jgi:predicted ribosomally synthesized peptide with SipW-like signal peptide
VKKLLITALVLILSVGMIGSAFAYFSDTETSTGNTFTTGTLDLVLSDNDETDQDGIVATWVSPAGWKPGEPEVSAWIKMKDIGTIGADLVSIHAQNLVESDNGNNEPEGAGSANNIADHIYVTSVHYTEKGIDLYGNLAGYYATCFGDGAAPLTLTEFATTPYSLVFWIGGWPPPEPYLPANGARVEQITLGFTFEPNAGNDYQSDTASFDLAVTAVQDYSQVTLLGKGPGLCYGYVD